VFATRADEIQQVPAGVSELCSLDGVEKGMGPEDAFWYGNFE
jgi:hypothetical protein